MFPLRITSRWIFFLTDSLIMPTIAHLPQSACNHTKNTTIALFLLSAESFRNIKALMRIWWSFRENLSPQKFSARFNVVCHLYLNKRFIFGEYTYVVNLTETHLNPSRGENNWTRGTNLDLDSFVFRNFPIVLEYSSLVPLVTFCNYEGTWGKMTKTNRIPMFCKPNYRPWHINSLDTLKNLLK